MHFVALMFHFKVLVGGNNGYRVMPLFVVYELLIIHSFVDVVYSETDSVLCLSGIVKHNKSACLCLTRDHT